MMVSKATTGLMDRIFGILRSFSKELNSMLGLSELFITATEPAVTKRLTSNPASRATCVQSNIATPLFRLVLEGKQDTISFYLIPTDNILSNEVSVRYSALSSWKAHFGPRDQVIWESPAGILTEEMLNSACLELIRHLIEATQDAIEATEGAITSEHTVQNQDMSGDLSEVVPGFPEKTEHTAKQTSSSDGMRTDSLPSLASCETGIFETAARGFETPSVKSLFEQDELSETVAETHELAKLEPTWQPFSREQTGFGKSNFQGQREQQDQIAPEVAKQTDLGKPNFPWQREQQDKIAPKVAKQTDFGKPNFPWQREQQDKVAPKVAKHTDFGKPNFPWQHEQKNQSVPEVAKHGDFGKPNFPWQHEQKDPEVPRQDDFAKPAFPLQQNQVLPDAALEQAHLVETKSTERQDQIIPETAIEYAEGKVEKEDYNADREEENTSKKGVSSKRLTRKTNSRRNRKKRNKKNKK